LPREFSAFERQASKQKPLASCSSHHLQLLGLNPVSFQQTIMSTKEVRIRPAGWESAPAEEQFALSDMDHTMPKIYVQIVEVFKLAPLFDKAKVVDSMAKGLEFTLSQFPILAGGLKMDAENGRL
jgi:hypothetical protein